MPVQGHDILRMRRGYMMIFHRKVGGPSLPAFLIINILHNTPLCVLLYDSQLLHFNVERRNMWLLFTQCRTLANDM